ncbi:MAG: transporter substrate-binding domain-containing protein [Kiritimatiellia bacterium]
MKCTRKFVAALLVAGFLAGCTDSKDDSLKMVTEATFPPYEFLRGQEIVGLDVEICRAVAQRLGRTFSVESVNFDSVIPAVISGKADLAAAGITVTEDRKKNVDFSIPYVKTGIVFVFKKASPYAKGTDAKGKKVGVQGGTTSENYVVDVLKQQPERFDSPAAAVAALKAGRVDAVLADIEPARNCVKGEADLAISDFITTEEYAVAIRKGRPDLLKAIDETIAELKANGKLAAWTKQYTDEADRLKDK